MNRDAAFYFANLGADVSRCLQALKQGSEGRYRDSLERAYRTLGYLRTAGRPEAYEEGLLMLRGLDFARATPEMRAPFEAALNSLVGAFSLRFVP